MTTVQIKYTIEPLPGGGAYVKIPVETSYCLAWTLFIFCAAPAVFIYFLSTFVDSKITDIAE
jgi:hypothetical protein